MCRPDCDLSDPNDGYCRSDRDACVAKTLGQKAVAVASTVGCIGTLLLSGCPTLATETVYGKGVLENVIDVVKSKNNRAKRDIECPNPQFLSFHTYDQAHGILDVEQRLKKLESWSGFIEFWRAEIQRPSNAYTFYAPTQNADYKKVGGSGEIKCQFTTIQRRYKCYHLDSGNWSCVDYGQGLGIHASSNGHLISS